MTKLTLLFHLTMHSLELQVNLSRKRSAVQKCRSLLSKTGFPKQCLHIFYLRKVSNIFTQKLLYSEIFGFFVMHSWLWSQIKNLPFWYWQTLWRTLFICKRCYLSVGELAKGRCTWHVKWWVRVVCSYITRTCKNFEGSCGVQDREDDQPQIAIVTMVCGVRWCSLYTLFSLMRSPRMVWHRSGSWKGEIGSSLFHHLVSVLITGYVHSTSWKQDGTLVFIWVLDCIQLRRSLEPHKESLWYNLLDANRQINSGMQTWLRSSWVLHGRQVRESRRTIRKL